MSWCPHHAAGAALCTLMTKGLPASAAARAVAPTSSCEARSQVAGCAQPHCCSSARLYSLPLPPLYADVTMRKKPCARLRVASADKT